MNDGKQMTTLPRTEISLPEPGDTIESLGRLRMVVAKKLTEKFRIICYGWKKRGP